MSAKSFMQQFDDCHAVISRIKTAMEPQAMPSHTPQMPFIYLACPLASPDPIVEADRIELASIAAAWLMDSGFAVFSPLSHCLPIKQHLAGPRPHQWWMDQDLRILHACDELFVLPLDGWRESKGVQMEIDYFQSQSRPIRIIQNLPHHADRLTAISEFEAGQAGWKLYTGKR